MANNKTIDNQRRDGLFKTRVVSKYRQLDKKSGNLYLTLQPQTKSYLESYNITLVDPNKYQDISDMAKTFRERKSNNNTTIFANIMIEFYNKSGLLIDQLLNPNDIEHDKYKDIISTKEEQALFAMLFIDPNLEYYKTYMNAKEDKIKALETGYGFVSKELLKIERLYDFIKRYEEQDYNHDEINYLAHKLFKL